MAFNLGDLIARVGADISGFRQAVGTDVPAIAGKSAAEAERGAQRIERAYQSLGPKLSSFGATLTAALTLPILAAGGAALKASADMESLRMGLTAITHNSAETEKQMARLRDVAKIPGLDFQGAVKGSINLQAAGFSAQLAERALKAFGNALATVGKGREDLEGVNLVLTQILNKPKVMAQDLNQLRERLPQISQAMKSAFGTAVSEDIQKLGVTGEQFVNRIIAEFEKLPPVASGLKNTFENVRDATFQSLAKLGDALAPMAMRFITVFVNPMISSITRLAERFQSLPGPVQSVVLGLGGLVAVGGPVLLVFGKLITAAGTLRDIYVATSAIMTTRLIPALFGTQAAVSAVSAGTIALGGTFTATGSTIAGSMTGATASVWSLHAALGAVGLALATIAAAWLAHKEAFGATGQSTPGRNTSSKLIIGPQGMPVPNPNYIPPGAGGSKSSSGARPNAADYVNSLMPPPAAKTGLDSEQIEKLYTALEHLATASKTPGMKDLPKVLDEGTKAFQALAGAGKLTHAQMLAAAGALRTVREQIAGARPELVELTKITAGGGVFSGTDYVTGGRASAPIGFVGPMQEAEKLHNAYEEMLEQLRNLPLGTRIDLASLPTYNGSVQLLTDTLAASATAAALAARNVDLVTDAYGYFGMKTPADLEKVAKESEAQWRLMKEDGQATPEAILEAWQQMFRDQIAAQRATGKITEAQYRDMLGQLDAQHKGSTQRRVRYERSIAEELGAQWRGAVESLERNLARAVLTWKGGFEAIKQFGANLAEDLLASFFKGFLKPLESQLEKLGAKIGGVFDKIWGKSTPSLGGGGGTTVPGTGGGGGVGGAAGAASGLASTLTAIGSIGSMVSGIIGNFQNAKMETTLNAIEHNTRYLQIQFQKFAEVDEWARETHLMHKLDDIWNSIRDVGKGGGATFEFRNCTFGAGLTQQSVNQMFQAAYQQAMSKVG